MWRHAEGNRRNVVVFVLLIALGELMWLGESLLIVRIFNEAQFSQGDPDMLRNILISLGALIVITLVYWAMVGPATILEGKNAFFVKKRYRESMLSKVLDLPAEWHVHHHSGDTIDKINKASDRLYDFSFYIQYGVKNTVSLFGSLAVLAFFDWRASIVALLVAVFAIFILIKFDVAARKSYKKMFRAENFVAAAIHDYVSNVMTVISLRLKPRVLREVDERVMKGFEFHTKNTVLNEWKWFVTNFLITVMIVTMIGFYAYRSYSISGIIAIGTLFALYQYLSNVGNTFYNFAYLYGEIVKRDAAVRAAEVINEAHAALPERKVARLPKDWKTIKVRNLSFSYKEVADKKDDAVESENTKVAQRIHLNDVGFVLERGKKIAFIGESGSGKSTALSIIRGLYEPSNADVSCDGKKSAHGLAHLSDVTTLIPQDPEIFNATVAENITMGLKSSKQDISHAMRTARFDIVLPKLPKGVETNVMEKGVSLSGGEKQRLALARGLFIGKKSDILLLDEPTSSVDSANEMEIYENIFKEFPEKTIVSSIHRLHLLRFFDRIYFFKQGKIIAEGDFETLLGNEEFKALWERYNESE